MSNEAEVAYVYGDVCLRKQRRKRQKILIIELLLDYAKHSTLHGLRYITERSLTIIEKLFWIITFLVSIALCSYLIKNVYVKWKNSPVIVTVSERFVSAGEVPFPSVTICPQTKSKATVYNFTEKIDYFEAVNNATEEEQAMFDDVSIVCDYQDSTVYRMLDRNHTNSSIITHIDFVAPSLLDALAICYWRDNPVNCDNMFKKVYTAEGLCFNMNGLAAEEMFRDTVQMDYKYSEREQPTKGWTLGKGYFLDNIAENEYFPKRGTENGAKPDLEVLLSGSDTDTDGICNGLNAGYKIYIQHPADFPQSSIYYYAAIDRQVSSLAVSFNLLGTSDTLQEYAPEQRQCYFPKDRQLHYFKIYTMKNCQLECLSNYTYEKCGCVGFYMPHNSSNQICVGNQLSCMEEAHDNMSALELRMELSKSNDGCRCLPACDTVEYEAEVLKTEFHLKRYLKKFYKLDDSMKFSKIEMFFKKPRFVSMRRSELFGLTDFLANIGGLLGVFLGFSFLSLVEILYFITLRVGFSLKRDLEEEKRSRDNSIKVKRID